ncbi:MAG: hypothetical protein WBG54_10835, partial [Acidobacteriaceae bacterium]
MLNAPPESESGLPKTSDPAEAVESPRADVMRPADQDVVSYLRAMARAEPEPIPEPEPRSPLQALLNKTASALRSAYASTGPAVLAKFRSSSERSVSTDAPMIVETPAEPVLPASTPSSVGSTVEPVREPLASPPVAASAPAVVVAPPVEPRAPRLAVLRSQYILWLRSATAHLRSLIPAKRAPTAADVRAPQFSRLMAWRSLLQSSVRSSWAAVQALPAAIRARMGVLRTAWVRMKALMPVMRAKIGRLEQQFSMLMARRRAAAAQPAEPEPRKARA